MDFDRIASVEGMLYISAMYAITIEPETTAMTEHRYQKYLSSIVNYTFIRHRMCVFPSKISL